MESDIGEIKVDIGTIKNDIRHIVQSLRELNCKEHKEKIFCLEKKQERVVTVWATISTAIILIGVIAGIAVHLRGIF